MPLLAHYERTCIGVKRGFFVPESGQASASRCSECEDAVTFSSSPCTRTFTLFTTFPAYEKTQRAADWFSNDREAWLTSGHVTGFYLFN